MTSDDELVQHAERAVIDAAVEWAKEQNKLAPITQSDAAQRLRNACYLLQRARTITGKVRLEEVERAMRERDGKKS